MGVIEEVKSTIFLGRFLLRLRWYGMGKGGMGDGPEVAQETDGKFLVEEGVPEVLHGVGYHP